jgi:hypothetical protein
MIVYPAAGYNTFVDLAQADTIAAGLLGSEEFLSLPDPDRERFLMAAFRYIEGLPGIVFPDNPEECINTAQVSISLLEVNGGFITGGKSLEYTEAKVGPIEVKYKDPKQIEMPLALKFCLEGYGAIIYNAGFNQANLRRA